MKSHRHNPLRKQAVATAALLAMVATSPLAFASTVGDPDAWHTPQPEQPSALLIQNATIWTSGSAGVIEGGDLLVRNGKIAAVGQGISAPRGAIVVDAAGKHVTPGLIDAHSHSAIFGSVNESSDISTAHVRIADVIDAESIDIYRQLAGGLTGANLLHGSANAIGGQNAIIKLRWGAPPEELLVDSAPQGIKFALGENPKQSNWGVETRRYPQSRQGVEQVIRERFQRAVDYRREWQEFRSSRAKDRVPPRRDFELDALVEILEGKRDVHSHSYRADEILMLMRVAEDFGFRIKCFQHVLEGYKIADELAAHGATASTFSDWWAYKFEVFDAIPYAGTIMNDRGVVVSFNSDSSELARRMNLEAAKAVRYGGMSQPDALKLVTLNPAIQLGIDDRTGSLEAGKDADFVVWSGHPLSTYTIAEQTWVDGRKYFDREADLAGRQALVEERNALMAKIRASKESEADDAEETEDATDAEADDSEAPEGDLVDEPPASSLAEAFGLASADRSATASQEEGR